MKTRAEKDMIGIRELPADALYGIHTLRALENFHLCGRTVAPPLIHAFGMVKLACVTTNHELGYIDDAKFNAVKQACGEMIAGELDKHIIVDAFQGGAGTSTNMNVNEVIANRALQIKGDKPGEYNIISPLDDINMHQSTNDTYPTALKVALILELHKLEKRLVLLLETFQGKEKEFAHIVKIGRTQMQDAVLTTLGRTMGAYAEAFGRDRWRVFKCEERLRVVNLGGTAIGTGLGAPRRYIFKVTENLKKITGIGLARAENLLEATQNNDEFVEVAAILNATASNLIKIASDIRFISSGPHAGIGEIKLPGRQAGSSIMPGKVNPVIPEAVTQAALAVISNTSAVTQAVSMGNLELNPFMPLIADKMLDSLNLLTNASAIFANFAIADIEPCEEQCRKHIENSTALITALIPVLGYKNAQMIIAESARKNISVKKAALETGLLTNAEFEDLILPESVNRLGSPAKESILTNKREEK